MALSSLDYLPSDQQKTHILVPLAPAGDQVLLLLPGKPDGPVWHSELSGFLVLRPSYPVGGRCVRSGHLQHSSLHSQNPEQVLTIPGGSASVVEPMARTTPPKVDTSSPEAHTVQALAARPKGKVPNDNLDDDDPDLLSFSAGLTQENWTVQFAIPDSPVFMTPDANSVFLVLGHEDVEGGLWASLWLAPPPPRSFSIGYPLDISA
jgi:hypothetical protein